MLFVHDHFVFVNLLVCKKHFCITSCDADMTTSDWLFMSCDTDRAASNWMLTSCDTDRTASDWLVQHK